MIRMYRVGMVWQSWLWHSDLVWVSAPGVDGAPARAASMMVMVTKGRVWAIVIMMIVMVLVCMASRGKDDRTDGAKVRHPQTLKMADTQNVRAGGRGVVFTLVCAQPVRACTNPSPAELILYNGSYTG